MKKPKFEAQDATLEDAVKLCRILEKILPKFGAHIALTGGCLYKDGPRKDIDLVVYRIRDYETPFDLRNEELLKEFFLNDISIINYYGFVTKARWKNFSVDILDPDDEDDAAYTEAQLAERGIVQ